MTYLRLAASWALFVVAVIIGLPSLLGVHIAESLGDIANTIWEKS